MTRQELIDLVVTKAREHGLVPYELLGGVIAESGLDPNAARYGAWPDVSFGLLQQTVAFADEGDQSASAENIDLIRRLYSNPSHALDVGAAKFKYWRYEPSVSPLQSWTAYNLPASYKLWPNVPNVAQRENYRAGLAKAQSILGVVPMPDRVVYNRDEPNVLQPDSWSCAPSALTWALRAVGRKPTEQWIANQMIAEGLESTAQGLLDGSGGGLAHFVREQYGEYGYDANNQSSVTFDALAAEWMTPNNPYPGLIGGHGWGGEGHWVGLRSYDPVTDVLVLANPAGDGATFGGQTMNRQQFAERGPFSLVRVLHPDLIAAFTPTPPPVPNPPPSVPPPPPPPAPAPDPTLARIRELAQEIISLTGGTR